jgi:hypothetical protein
MKFHMKIYVISFCKFVSYADPIYVGSAHWSSTQGMRMRTILLPFATLCYFIFLAVYLYSPINVTCVGTYAKWG